MRSNLEENDHSKTNASDAARCDPSVEAEEILYTNCMYALIFRQILRSTHTQETRQVDTKKTNSRPSFGRHHEGTTTAF
jgi:hypothetical protein